MKPFNSVNLGPHGSEQEEQEMLTDLIRSIRAGIREARDQFKRRRWIRAQFKSFSEF